MRFGLRTAVISIGLGLIALGLTNLVTSGPNALQTAPINQTLEVVLDGPAADARASTLGERALGKSAEIAPPFRAATTLSNSIRQGDLGRDEFAHTEDARDLEDPPPSGPALERLLERTIADEERKRAFSIQASVIDTIVERGDVRIVFSTEAPPAEFKDVIEPSAQGEGADLRFFPAFDHASARVDAKSLLGLIRSGVTAHIELDAVHRPTLAASLPIIRADLSHIDGNDGDGQAIAILDTGVDVDHPMISNRDIEEACFSLLGDCPNDLPQMTGLGAGVPCTASGCGHGTAVAGIALGRAEDESLIGVAPRADLIAIQIFSLIDSDIGAYSSDILAAMQHVLSLSASHNIAAVNLSLGGDDYTTSADCNAASSSQVAAVSALRARGIVVIAAAGNGGQIDRISTPGCLSNVISVGATRDDDTIASFSNTSELLSVYAPGQSIESTRQGGGTGWVSGTSMATPHVAGAVAAIREALPAASVSEIENALVLTGRPIFDARNGVTKQRIDVPAAIDFIAASAAVDPVDPIPGGGGGTGAAGAAASPAGGGGGSSCGLIGIEPFLVLGGIRLTRAARRRAARAPLEA